MQKTGDEEI